MALGSATLLSKVLDSGRIYYVPRQLGKLFEDSDVKNMNCRYEQNLSMPHIAQLSAIFATFGMSPRLSLDRVLRHFQ
jgi:hypothetical protein